MNKRRLMILGLVLALVTAVFFWQHLPAILKAMPSRYVARLPQPLQELGERGDGLAILPTAPAPVDVATLLEAVPLPTIAPVAEPPTPSPPALVVATVVPDTPTPSPPSPPTLVPIPASVRLEGFRHQFQTWNSSGSTIPGLEPVRSQWRTRR